MKYDNLVSLDMLYTDTVSATMEKSILADDVYHMLYNSYRDIPGGLHFSNEDDLVSKTDVWKIIYFESTIVGVVIYKAKRGLKMVALALSSRIDSINKGHAKRMLSQLFRMTFRHTWMEISEDAERFIIKNGGKRYLVSNTMASVLTGKEIVGLCEDGYHYTRVINGVLKRKIIIGNPNKRSALCL